MTTKFAYRKMLHRGALTYEIRVIACLCIIWGIVSFEYLTVSFLVPFIKPDLKLTDTQVGILVSGFWVPFGLSSYLVGEFTDRIGNRKALLMVTLVLFSLCSVLAGFTTSFAMLLSARLLMGLLEGPVLPLAQSIVAISTPPEHRGMNMGIVQTVGSGVMGGVVAPVLLIALAVHYGWRFGFFAVAIPGLTCTVLLGRVVREADSGASRPSTGTASSPDASPGIREVLKNRNIWLCSALSFLFVAYSLIGLGYLPLFYVKERHLQPQEMSVLMSTLGFAGVVMGVAIPALADRIGRRPTAIIASALGILCPLAALHCSGSLGILGLLMFIGWAPQGASILYMATIPSESVPARSISTSIGLTFAAGTLLGGGIGPVFAGWIADHWGLRASLWLEGSCATLMAVGSCALRETMRRQKRAISSHAGIPG